MVSCSVLALTRGTDPGATSLSKRGNRLEVMAETLQGKWLTFLRLKALSSSFSTALIFLMSMVQRASFPVEQKALLSFLC